MEERRNKDMEAVLKECVNTDLQNKLKFISSKSPMGKTKNGRIILDKNSSSDSEWYNEDEHKEE